jgi:vancomycin permeability regulator SanA
MLLLCAVLMGTLVLTVSTSMVRITRERITAAENLADTPTSVDYDCILVLGAGVKDDGTPSDMLYDRVQVACETYAALAGKAPLLMTGDHRGDYNEVGVMKSLAAEMGVPTEDIFLDHEGYSTYESLYRAKHIFGAKRVVIITQEYHLHRALHIARELGMEAVGVSADLRPYRGQSRYELREVLARFKDMFSAARGDYDGPLDPPVDLGGDGNGT